MLKWLSTINAWISRLCMYVAVAGLLAIVVVVAWQVFGRYVLNNTPTWAESLALVLVLYVTMFGAAVGVRDARHIGLDSLAFFVPDRYHIWFELTCHVLVGLFGLIMAWNGGKLAQSVMTYKIPVLGLSEGLNHIPLVIAGLLIFLFSIEHILALLADTKVEPSWH
ncbi:TRAP transporter small permease [Dongia sp.]|uniref:TRAP transporter small permease n=1 Tax=Dongia sp. TaxID=1977262 RepID=UPI0035B31BDC